MAAVHNVQVAAHDAPEREVPAVPQSNGGSLVGYRKGGDMKPEPTAVKKGVTALYHGDMTPPNCYLALAGDPKEMKALRDPAISNLLRAIGRENVMRLLGEPDAAIPESSDEKTKEWLGYHIIRECDWIPMIASVSDLEKVRSELEARIERLEEASATSAARRITLAKRINEFRGRISALEGSGVA